jgi:endonuclease/exonuclease/phosphatase family metal-dependent hydrolase/regulation of enolase protein 1 (concanavalin A-like superfamily)
LTHRHSCVPAICFLVFALFALAPSVSAGALPAGWTTKDIGTVGAAGSAAASATVFTLTGAGADVWNAADEFRFAYTTLTGDGEIVARVDSLERVDGWSKAGVMMRETLSAGSKHAFMLVSSGRGLAFQRRTASNAASSDTDGGAGTAPGFVRITRAGNVFTAYRSSDGTTWTRVGSATIAMASTIYVGLAVTSHADRTAATARYSHVAVSAKTSVPAGWETADIGTIGAVGSATADSSVVRVDASGADIWNTADEFRFVYTTLTGNGSVVTRVTSLEQVDAWTKAGVMMRASLAPGAQHAFMLVSAGKGLAFQRRTATDGASIHTAAGSGDAPYFVRLSRDGNEFTAYKSSNGTTWTRVGSSSIAMGQTVYVGIAVTSHHDGSVATAKFADTALTTGSSDPADPGKSDTPPPPETKPEPPSKPAPPSSSKTLRVLHWNTHHGGYGTDGKYDPDRLATWIAKENPDVVSLNEVEKKTGWGNEDQPAKYKALLEAKTGHPWYMVWAQEYGSWDSNGKGNVIYSRYPWTATARYLLSYERTVALGQINVNGRNITFVSTHLDPDSGSRRLTETRELIGWLDNFAESRIVVGDMNAQPTSTEMTLMKQTSTDAWDKAKKGGYAHASSDNTNGYTRHSRIDFVFTSNKASALTLTRVEVIDTRDAKGVMPSDHRPVLAVYSVK